MQLKLFGEFSLIAPSGQRMVVPLRRGQALIAYLASKESRRESREVLLDFCGPIVSRNKPNQACGKRFMNFNAWGQKISR